jgi:disulfide bond formation protein DsbB
MNRLNNFLLLCTAYPARLVLAALLALAVGLLVTGFTMEYAFGVLPCPMCWWQRYAHAVIALLALVGVLSGRHRVAAGGVTLAAGAGLGVALWQVAAQQGWLPWPPSCAGDAEIMTVGADLLSAMAHTTVVPCDQETFTIFGLSLAVWNVPAMLFVLGAAALVWLDDR